MKLLARICALDLGVLLAAAAPQLYADEAEERAQRPEPPAFTDAEQLDVPVQASRVQVLEGLMVLGVRASSAIVEPAPARFGPNVTAALSLDLSDTSFPATSGLQLGIAHRFVLGAALGYGYQFAAKYEVGAFLPSDESGSGAVLAFGGQGEVRSLGRVAARTGAASLSRFLAFPSLGYVLQRDSVRIDLALLPSLGGVSAHTGTASVTADFWLRERLRARAWGVVLEIEQGRDVSSEARANYWEGALCSGPGHVPLLACTSVLALTGPEQGAHAYEVAITLGLGTLLTETKRSSYGPTVRLRSSP